MITYFHDYTREDGSVVTVEYGYYGGSPATYSPAFGASGGDAPEVEIVKAFDDSGDVTLTDAEMEAAEEQIHENPPEYDDQSDFYD